MHVNVTGGARRSGVTAGMAGTAAVLIVGQALTAPIVLLVGAVLLAVGRVARWRPSWLLLPSAAGGLWLALAGGRTALVGLATGAARISAAELAVGAAPGRLLDPATLSVSADRWLLPELPLALLAGTAEAAVALLACRQRGARSPWRPGLLAAVRRRLTIAALRSGQTVTAAGCAIGIQPATGSVASLTWAAAQRGVLVSGPDTDVGSVAGAVACAALRRRKTLVAVDLADGILGAQVAGIARRLQVPASRLDAAGDCAATSVDTGATSGESGVPAVGSGAIGGDGRTTELIAGAVGKAIRSRTALLLPAAEPGAGTRAVAGVTVALRRLRDYGLRGDCVICVAGCEQAEPGLLAGLLAVAVPTGTSVVLMTGTAGAPAALALLAGTTVTCGAAPGTGRPDDDHVLPGLQRGEFEIIAAGDAAAPLRARTVPLRLAELR